MQEVYMSEEEIKKIIEYRDKNGNTILHISVIQNNMNRLDYWSKHIPVDTVNNAGESVAFLAVDQKNCSILEFLVRERGANLKILPHRYEDKFLDCRDYAIMMGLGDEIIEYLESLWCKNAYGGTTDPFRRFPVCPPLPVLQTAEGQSQVAQASGEVIGIIK